MRHLMDIVDLSVEEVDSLCERACDMIKAPDEYVGACKGKKLATLFYEPSTRTRLSFEAAMMELGGNVLGFSSGKNASVSKGESVYDTAKIVSCYADIIAIRHNLEGAAKVASIGASVPVINGGDGSHFHPTQTLADLLTIYREKGTFNGLSIGICGDLKYGRTVHSLIKAMTRYENNRFFLISPEELKLPGYLKSAISEEGRSKFIEMDKLEDALPEIDILYMTRIQRERFPNQEDYERLKNSYRLSADNMREAKDDMIVMHPLPRVNEISVDVDEDRRAAYFRQALNGKYMRMALILMLLEESDRAAKRGERAGMGREALDACSIPKHKFPGEIIPGKVCTNPSCICRTEQGLESRFTIGEDGICRCAYCDSEASDIKTSEI